MNIKLLQYLNETGVVHINVLPCKLKVQLIGQSKFLNSFDGISLFEDTLQWYHL